MKFAQSPKSQKVRLLSSVALVFAVIVGTIRFAGVVYHEYINASLTHAAEEGDAKAVKELTATGADWNATDKDGRTVLMMAVNVDGGGDVDCVRALIEKGADVNAKDRFGRTALMLSVASGNIDCIRLIVASGANVNVKTDGGVTALSLAHDDPGVAAILKHAGAK